MKTKATFRIKKYNYQTQKTEFPKDISDIQNENILFKKDNYLFDIIYESNIKIENGMTKFQKIYGKKCSSISNTCMIITFSILDQSFFKKNYCNQFYNDFYNTLDKYLDIISYIVTIDALGDILIYAICTTVTKNIFLDHILERNADKDINSLIGVLSYNLILGGTIAEKPELKFAELIFNELSKYNLIYTSQNDNYQYTLNLYRRASKKFSNVESDLNTLFITLEKEAPELKSYLLKIIEENNLNELRKFLQ